jgi:hypothetical protein
VWTENKVLFKAKAGGSHSNHCSLKGVIGDILGPYEFVSESTRFRSMDSLGY